MSAPTTTKPEIRTIYDLTGRALTIGQLIVFPMSRLSDVDELGIGAVVGFDHIGGRQVVEIRSDRFTSSVRLRPEHLAVIADEHNDTH